jgi:drug/metabolite transporter (DMT)-like permease
MAAALASALGWTLVSLVARDLAAQLPSLSLNIIRSAGGSILLVPVALAFGDIRSLGQVSAVAWACLTVSVLTALGIGDTAFFESTKTIGLARAMTISMIYPLIASALGVWLLGERITTPIAIGTLVTLAGLAVIVSERTAAAGGESGEARRGLGLALLSAVVWGISPVMMAPAIAEVDPVSIQAVRLPLAAGVLWITPWSRGAGARVRRDLRAVGPLLLVIGVLTALSAVTWVAALKYAGITVTTVLSSTSPLFAIPIGLIAFGERVSARAVGGILLAVAGIVLLSL